MNLMEHRSKIWFIWAQGVQSNLFQRYDYGTPEANQLHYNQTTPPPYTLRPLKVPTAIFWSGNDWLADPVDVVVHIR